jgi:hypothetical protein
MDKAQALMRMKEQMDRAGKKESELKGQIKEVLSRLKKDFDCSSKAQGEKKVESLQKTLDKKQAVFDKGLASLQKKMDRTNEEE